jgi:hypothetical protein
MDDPGDLIPEPAAFFTKPYREEQIIETIRSMLA